MSFARVPLGFEPNRGQASPATRFLAHAQGATVSLGGRGVTLGVSGRAVHVGFANAHPAAPEASRRAPGRVNYMVGRDRSRWQLGIPTYSRVVYRHAWRGIDLAFHGAGRRLEYDLVLAPHADPGQIGLRMRGAHVDRSGALVAGRVRELPPRTTQAGRAVASRYVRRGRGVYGVELAAHDPGRRLVIDPVLTYSTYLGGSGSDLALATAVGADGSTYVAGNTTSDGPAPAGFPTAPGPPYKATNSGNGDAFVTRLNPLGNALVYSTYFGGTGIDDANGIAVDPAGDAFFAGDTTSSGTGSIPTQNPYQGANAGGSDAFVAELDPAGTGLLYSTYFGGGGNDDARGIALDALNRPHISGNTNSVDFPHNDLLVQPGLGGGTDAYLAILSGGGSTLPLSTYIGGSDSDFTYGLAVDSAGDSYVAGQTYSSPTDSKPFPLKTPYQSTLKGANDAFLTKITAAGDLAYSTYLGGADQDFGFAVTVDASKRAYLTGQTSSTDFPLLSPVDSTNGSVDGFVTEFAPAGSSLVASTFLGGPSGGDAGQAIATAPDGGVWLAGVTSSTDFPTAAPIQPSNGGGSGDAFAAHLSAGLGVLVFSTYLGGGASDDATGLAVDGAGTAYLAGATFASTTTPFPTTAAFQPTFGGGQADAFVAKLGPTPAPSGGGGGGGSGTGAQNGGTQSDTGLPLAVVSGLEFANTSIAAQGSGPPATNAKRKPPRGTRVSFKLNEAASVRFTVTQRLKGRKVKHGKKTVCVKPKRSNRKKKSCTRVVTLKGSFSRNGVAGKNSFHFTGRLNGRKLKPGRYRLVATPSAGGRKGKPTSVGFRIVR